MARNRSEKRDPLLDEVASTWHSWQMRPADTVMTGAYVDARDQLPADLFRVWMRMDTLQRMNFYYS